MSKKNPWEAHGHQFQAPTGSVQMFDPSKFQTAPVYGVGEAQPDGFDHGVYQNEAEMMQPHFAADPSWNTQQQHQDWYESQGGLGHFDYGNSEYGWPQAGENPEMGAASDASLQYQGNYDSWQHAPQQDSFYYRGGGYGGEHMTNYAGHDFADDLGQAQNYAGNDTVPPGTDVGMNYPGGDNWEQMGLRQDQGNVLHPESSHEAISYCASSAEVPSSTDLQSDDSHLPPQPTLDSEERVSASSSFAKLPHHPSPFDEIPGFASDDIEKEKSDRLSLPTSTSHSRQSSCSGAKFILGSSELIPDVDRKNVSPPLAGKIEQPEEELTSDQQGSKLAVEPPGDGKDAASSSSSGENLNSCPPVGEQMFLPPPLAARPGGTMTGIPARNQFRKVAEPKTGFALDIASGPVHVPPSDEPGNQLPAVQCSGSGGISTEGASVTSSSSDPSQVHLGTAPHFWEGGSEPFGMDPGVVQPGQDHQLNIYAMPLAAHPGSSFLPVNPRSLSASDNRNLPSHEASNEHLAIGSVDLGATGPKEPDGRSYGGNIVHHQDQLKDVSKPLFLGDSHGFPTNAPFSPHSSQKQRPFHDSEVHKDERPALKDYPEVPSQLHSVLPKLHRDKTMSPAATLWENPDPLAGVGICLVPAAVSRETVPDHHVPSEHGKNVPDAGGAQPVQLAAGFNLPQNTGTGPGKSSNVVPPSHFGNEQTAPLGFGSKVSDVQNPPVGFNPNPQMMNRQVRDSDAAQQSSAAIGDVSEGGVSGIQPSAMGSSSFMSQYTVTPVEMEASPRIVAHVRNESIDSLAEEFARLGDSGSATKGIEQKLPQGSAKSAGEMHPETVSLARSIESNDPHRRVDDRSGIQKVLATNSGRELSENPPFSEVNKPKNSVVVRQESSANPVQVRERFGQGPRENYSGAKPDMSEADTSRANRTGIQENKSSRDANISKSNEQILPRNVLPSDDRRGAWPPDDKSSSRHSSSSEISGHDQFEKPQNPRDRREYPRGDYEDPRSRNNYQPNSQNRPQSRQGYPDEPYARSNSRQGYPDDPYGRPRSRQGYPAESYDRPNSRQGYPDRDRPRSRPGGPDDFQSRSRQDYHGDYRPHSRQGYPADDRTRQGYPEDPYNRPRSRQDYPYDQYDRKRSREDYPPEYYDRPRSRQGYPNAYPDDPRGRYPDYGKSQHGYNERPQSRQEMEATEGNRNGYPDRYEDESRSRRGYPDDYDYKSHRGYSGESYDRPRSRQQENENSRYDDPEQSYHQSRHGGDRTRSEVGRRSRDDRDRGRYDYDEYYREYYSRYMQYVYQQGGYQQGGYQQYYPYQYPNRYDKGYLEEMAHYGQIPMYDPRYVYDQASKAQSGSQHNSTRGSSPAQDQLSSAADNFARGSRPGSSFSGAEPSPRAVESGYSLGSYNDQPYGYPEHVSFQEPTKHRMTPMKFIVPHARASFGPSGQLIHVLPNSPADGQPGVVELIEVGGLLAGSAETEELKRFPGPLVRNDTHKNDVLLFCQKMAQECRNSMHLVDRESAELIWRYLELLIKQNGTIIGTDVADLLLDGHEPATSVYEKNDLHIACSREDLSIDDEGSSSISADRSVFNRSVIETGIDEATDRFRHLLLHGRKKDALEWAMKRNLWGHALFLASKMDAKTHANIMTRFANVSMKMNDPLQTLYQIMSGRQPAAVTLIHDDKWGDWRPHLCIILSNPTQKAELDKKSIVTLGDTLASRSLFFAAQFCYLVAQVPFGQYHKKSSKIVLLGSSHSSPFEEFATSFAIQCTETYEYSLSLATPNFALQTIQAYKFIYMLRLLDYGFLEEALKYAEVLAGIIVQAPSVFSPSLAKALYNVSCGIRLCDPQRLLMDESEEVAWFQQLHQVVQRIEEGSILYQSGHGTTSPGRFSTGASSEVAEILGQQQVAEFGQNSTAYAGANAVAGTLSYADSQGSWSQAPVEHQQTVWNPVTQSYDQYVYRDQHWELLPNPVGSQPPAPNMMNSGGNAGFVTDPGYEATPANTIDQPDGSTGQEMLDNISQYPESATQFKPGSSGPNNFAVQESASLTSFSSASSGVYNRQRTISSSSSHSQQLLSSRRTSVNTVHGPTPPSSPGHQMSGPSAPLGAKKKQYWPGEEPDENENSNSKTSSKADKQMAKNKDGNKSTGWLGGFFSRISRPKEMILPDDKDPKIVWDKEKNRWINTDDDPNEADKNAGPLAPPKDFEVTQKMSTPTVPTPSPNEFSGNKFSRQKTRGARGQYVDVLGSSTKPSPVAPNNLLNVLPKSASMPANVFIPNARASEEGDEITASHEPRTEPPVSADPKTIAANQDHSVRQIAPERMPNFPAVPQTQQPPNKASEVVNSTEGTPLMPMMFNPAQFGSNLSAAPSMMTTSSSSSANSHLKYGQRRIYPK